MNELEPLILFFCEALASDAFPVRDSAEVVEGVTRQTRIATETTDDE